MQSLIEALERLVGRENVRTGAGAEEYAWDALSPARASTLHRELSPRPVAAVLPRSAEDIAGTLQLARQHGARVVAYGGGSGLMGGAVPIEPSVVIDMKSLNAISVNVEDGSARAQAGVILKDLEKELNAHGLMLGHDPWSLPIATVGGAISTDSLGYRGAKYGSMGKQVLALTAVMPDGQVLSTRPVAKASVGMDLKSLFIGTEGCFGIVTEAVVRAWPLPEKRALGQYQFPSFEAGLEAILEITDLDLRPSLLDFGEKYSPGEMEAGGAVLYLGFEGCKEVVEASDSRSWQIVEKRGGRAGDSREAERFWEERHQTAERFAERRRLGDQRSPTGFDFVHVSVPRSKILELRDRYQRIVKETRVTLVECGLWCWPELFSAVVSQGGPGEADAEGISRAVEAMLAATHDLGGAMEYCHGVGLRLAHLMERELGRPGLEVERAIKRGIDSGGILNPGKLGL